MGTINSWKLVSIVYCETSNRASTKNELNERALRKSKPPGTIRVPNMNRARVGGRENILALDLPNSQNDCFFY